MYNFEIHIVDRHIKSISSCNEYVGMVGSFPFCMRTDVNHQHYDFCGITLVEISNTRTILIAQLQLAEHSSNIGGDQALF